MRAQPNLVRQTERERGEFLVKILKMNDLEGAPMVGMPLVMEMFDDLERSNQVFLLPLARTDHGVCQERVNYVSDQLEGLVALEEFVRANTIDHGAKDNREK